MALPVAAAAGANPLAALGIGAGGGLLNLIFGSDDEFQMSPEARQLFQQYAGQLKNFQGFSPSEHSDILGNIRGSLKGEFRKSTKASESSLARRGLLDPGSFTAATAQGKGKFAEAFGKANEGVNLASRRRDFDQKNLLRQMMNQLAGGQKFTPGQGLPGLEGIGMNLNTLLNPPQQPQNNTQSLIDLLNQ